LSDSDVLDRLSKPFDAFPEASPQTKSLFEQKTSAINVTPSTGSRYDIKEIKEDTLWLSNIAKVDEVSALRIVVGECQSRPAAQLHGPFSEEEVASLHEASGNTKYSSDIVLAALPQGVDAKQIKKTFDSQDARRQRILLTYLSERRHFLKCAELLIRSSRSVHSYVAQSRKGKGTDPLKTRLQNIGSNVEQKLGNGDTLMIRAAAAIKANVRNMESPSGWFGEAGFTDSFELEWNRSQITEITHAMEIIFEIIDRSETVTSSQVILEWLRLLQTCEFFGSLQTVSSPITFSGIY
jgi:nuclear pore complex protein Nup188